MRAAALVKPHRFETELQDRVLAADTCLRTVSSVGHAVRIEVEASTVDALEFGIEVVALNAQVGGDGPSAERHDEACGVMLELASVHRRPGLRFRDRVVGQVLEWLDVI